MVQAGDRHLNFFAVRRNDGLCGHGNIRDRAVRQRDAQSCGHHSGCGDLQLRCLPHSDIELPWLDQKPVKAANIDRPRVASAGVGDF